MPQFCNVLQQTRSLRLKFRLPLRRCLPQKFLVNSISIRRLTRPPDSPFVFPVRQSRVPWPTVPMFDKADAQGVRRMNEEWSDRSYKSAVNVCVHNHRPACRKLPSGLMRCRFSMPCPECQQTNAVQIRLQQNMTPRTVEVHSDVSEMCVDCGKDRDFFRYPTTKRDKRVIIWDVVRRIMPDLLLTQMQSQSTTVYGRASVTLY